MTSHVVIIAFGPARVTRAAVSRARRLAGHTTPVSVVPAWPHARKGLGCLQSPLVHVTDESGRPAVEEAIDALPGTVLLIHDDLLVTSETLNHLERAHAATGSPVVPYSNEVGTTGYVGALPAVRHAVQATRSTATTHDRDTQADQFRTSCVLGRQDQVRRLTRARLTDPRSLVREWPEPVTLATGAVVAHDSSCAEQLPSDDTPEGRPLLVAALIVRDEEAMLPDCLRSLEGLVDRVVVGDTGSLDRTVEIARDHGAEVVHVAWQDDFAAARSKVLDHCRDAWFVLQVDADERVVCGDVDRLRRRLVADVGETGMFDIRIDNILDGQVHTSFEAPRLYRPQDLVYEGALHERPVHRDGLPVRWMSFGGLHLQHLGYDPAVVGDTHKKSRNINIARRAHQQAPSPGTQVNLLRALAGAGQEHEEQETLARDLLDSDTDLPDGLRAHVLGILGGVTAHRNPVAARGMLREALELSPGEDRIAHNHAALAFEAGDFADVIATANSRQKGEEAVFRSATERAAELRFVALSHVALEDLASAAEVAGQAAQCGDHLEEQAWVDLISILSLADPERLITRLGEWVSPASADPCLEAVSRVLGRDVAGPLAVDLVAGDTVTPSVVQLGLAWAVVNTDHVALATLQPHVGILAPGVVEKLVEVAAGRGWQTGASVIAGALLQGV